MSTNLKLVEQLMKTATTCDAATPDRVLAEREVLALLVLEHRDVILSALRRPSAHAGPAEVETIEKVVYHHFYPGPLSGATTRLANALIDAFPALQGHEA